LQNVDKIPTKQLSQDYSFENDIGILEIRKSDGHIKEIDPVMQDEFGRIFERAARIIARYWIKGEYPEKTFWAS
jgi:hypothetical protein